MSQVDAFSTLNDTQIAKMIDIMEHERFSMNSIICHEGDVALKFYIIMSGYLGVFQKKGISNERCLFDESERRVGDLPTYSFFGENALLGEDARRNATVKVESDMVSVLSLQREVFYKLLEQGELDTDVLGKMWTEKRNREDSNSRMNVENTEAIVEVNEV